MAEYYDSLTFSDYPPTELLGSRIYNDSIKRNVEQKIQFLQKNKSTEKTDDIDVEFENKDNVQGGLKPVKNSFMNNLFRRNRK